MQLNLPPTALLRRGQLTRDGSKGGEQLVLGHANAVLLLAVSVHVLEGLGQRGEEVARCRIRGVVEVDFCAGLSGQSEKMLGYRSEAKSNHVERVEADWGRDKEDWYTRGLNTLKKTHTLYRIPTVGRDPSWCKHDCEQSWLHL